MRVELLLLLCVSIEFEHYDQFRRCGLRNRRRPSSLQSNILQIIFSSAIRKSKNPIKNRHSGVSCWTGIDLSRYERRISGYNLPRLRRFLGKSTAAWTGDSLKVSGSSVSSWLRICAVVTERAFRFGYLCT